ncbi:hypothetical protein PUN28_002358 [Cardiocondyla obscurior]|uniref:Uncharacterized protein n=1 Tax=Cardiocondyla obscurior TaxID=286306 RepID=A0AAW2GTU4_9HYME
MQNEGEEEEEGAYEYESGRHHCDGFSRECRPSARKAYFAFVFSVENNESRLSCIRFAFSTSRRVTRRERPARLEVTRSISYSPFPLFRRPRGRRNLRSYISIRRRSDFYYRHSHPPASILHRELQNLET